MAWQVFLQVIQSLASTTVVAEKDDKIDTQAYKHKFKINLHSLL